jgi:Protein of unknown function (DUF3108)
VTPNTTSALRRWLPLLLAVSLAHWAVLHGLRQLVPPLRPLATMADPLFTRLLQAAEPVAPAAAPTPLASPAPVPPAAKKTTARRVEATATSPAAIKPPEPMAVAEPGTAIAQATAPPTGGGEPAPVVESAPLPVPLAQAEPPALPEPGDASPQVPPAAPETAQAPADPLRAWPLDTRLSYRMGGFYRGDLHGSAQVQWQRDKSSYQVKLTVGTAGLTLATLTSQGVATHSGLVPRVYEEQVPGGLRRAEFSDGWVRFQNGNAAVLPPGAQDSVSQFVDLAHRFATGREVLAAGGQVRVWLGRPGGLDEWIYDVGESEILDTPQLGPIAAFRLTPRPLANPRGAITAELWFAPSLQYLPVRVRITLGGGNFVDLMVEQIEQSDVVR